MCPRREPEAASPVQRDDLGGGLGRGSGDLGQDGGLGVVGHGDGRVPQPVLHDVQVHSGGAREGRRALTEVVESDRGKPGLAGEEGEPVGHVRRVLGAAVGLVDHEPGLHPVLPGGLFLGVASVEVSGEHQSGVLVEGDGAFGTVGLGCAHGGFPAVLHDLVGHVDRASLQVYVHQAQTRSPRCVRRVLRRIFFLPASQVLSHVSMSGVDCTDVRSPVHFR